MLFFISPLKIIDFYIKFVYNFIKVIELKKKLLTIMLLTLVIFPNINVNARTLQSYYDELDALQASYNAAKAKANMTQAELNNLKSSIASAEAQIRTTQNEITEAEQNIKKSEEDIAEKKEQTNQMLLYLQLSNNDESYIEYIFEAEDYTDFIYRYEVVNQLSDYNNKLIEELNTLITTLQTKKVELTKKQNDLANQKRELQSKYAILQVRYKDENDDSQNISGQISEMRKQIQGYEALGCKRNQDVNSCGGFAAVTGWTYPIPSFYQSSNYGWDENRYHYAVDLAVAEGTTVRAVANGKVISSSVYWKQGREGVESCGGYVIQIQHNYGGSSYVSLYMHLITGYVSVNDVVTQGQPIGLSGGASQEKAKWNDTCTFGQHLHFAMAYGDSRIGSSGTQGSTFDPVKFFPAMQGIGSVYRGG